MIEDKQLKRLLDKIDHLTAMVEELTRREKTRTVQVQSQKWVSIEKACELFNTSEVTLRLKRRMFEQVEGRGVRTCAVGRGSLLLDYDDLLKATQLRSRIDVRKKINENKKSA